jgi:hypothetical protein
MSVAGDFPGPLREQGNALGLVAAKTLMAIIQPRTLVAGPPGAVRRSDPRPLPSPDFLHAPLLLGQDSRVVQGDLLVFMHQVLLLLLFLTAEFPLIVLVHQGIESVLFVRRQAREFRPLPAEIHQLREAHVK